VRVEAGLDLSTLSAERKGERRDFGIIWMSLSPVPTNER
jgi:hypothetical protein